jgi:PAS domain-containing protein
MAFTDPELGPISITQMGAVRLCSDMPIGMGAMTKEGKFRWVNTAMCRWLEYTEGQLLSMSLAEITHEKYLNVDRDLMQKLLTGELTSYTVVKAFHKSGSRPERPRYAWGSLTVFREPVVGEVHFYWIFFVPHNDMKESGGTSWKEILIFLRDNYKWIATVIAIVIALASGNFTAISALLNKQSVIERELHSGPPQSSSGSGLLPQQSP